MSWANTAYIKKLNVTPDGQPLSKSEKLLLFVLADYHNEDSNEAWVSLARLAAQSLQSPSGTIRLLQGLERKNVLQIIRDASPSVQTSAQKRQTTTTLSLSGGTE